MFPFQEFSHFVMGDMTVYYLQDGSRLTFTLIPTGMENQLPEHRLSLKDTVACRGIAKVFQCDFPASVLEDMTQFKLVGDGYPNRFAPGNTMRGSASLQGLEFEAQKEHGNTVETIFSNRRGIRLIHTVKYRKGTGYLEINTSITNNSAETVELEMLDSFSIGMLSPFQPDDGLDKYRIHRFRSFWSMEGRHESTAVEDLGLEMSWSTYGMRVLRFGQTSSMPVKEFFPMIGFEDTDAGVVWGAQLAATGPWRLEATRFADHLNLSGGHPDRELGNWTKKLQPGETFRGPAAIVSCVKGDIQDLMTRLTAWPIDNALSNVPSETDLPVIFNEWCTTWGCPSRENLLPIARTLKGHGIRYFVLDDGWFKSKNSKYNGIGDWIVSEEKYPGGLKKFTGELRKMGFIPGVWFEFENCLPGSHLLEERPELLLTLDDRIYQTERRFLDFRKKEVWDYLDEKLIRMLKENDFGYLKVDYNAPIGFGADTENGSPAEGLREHLEAVGRYYRHLRRELPELVIEICSSGGHRLTPEWMRIGNMGSFSDAHEGESIPLIGASTQQLIPMERNQIWAVLRAENDAQRLYYSLAAGFLGRLCLSGEIDKLSPRQKKIMFEAVDFYHRIAPLVKYGVSRLERKLTSRSSNYPAGWQILTRSWRKEKMLVIHGFRNTPEQLSVCLNGNAEILGVLKEDTIDVRIGNGKLLVSGLRDYSGLVVLVRQ